MNEKAPIFAPPTKKAGSSLKAVRGLDWGIKYLRQIILAAKKMD